MLIWSSDVAWILQFVDLLLFVASVACICFLYYLCSGFRCFSWCSRFVASSGMKVLVAGDLWLLVVIVVGGSCFISWFVDFVVDVGGR